MEKRLIRNIPDKMIGGVAAGLADYLGIDITVVRLLFVVATFFHGSGLLIYIVLWIAMPAGVADPSLQNPVGNPAMDSSAGNPAGAPNPSFGNPDPSGRNTAQQPGESQHTGNKTSALIGWILVGFGVYFLMHEFLQPWFREFFYWFNFSRIWPIIFIVVGVLIISSATRKRAVQNPGSASTGPPPGPSDSPPPGPASPPAASASPQPPVSPVPPGSPGDSSVPPASPGGSPVPPVSPGDSPVPPGSTLTGPSGPSDSPAAPDPSGNDQKS